MNKKLIKKSLRKSLGLAPGTAVYTGDRELDKVKITVIDYDENQFEEKEVKTVEECFPFKEKSTVTWINVDGIHNIELIEKLTTHFDLHPLILEDIVDITQRPKIQDFVSYIFLSLKIVSCKSKDDDINPEHVSFILGPNFVISFQETVGDIFDPVRDRIRNAKGRIRKMEAGYLVYTLIDAIVDNYFVILERIAEKIEKIEEELVENPTPQTVQLIHNLKRDTIYLRKSVWPLREVINGLERGESSLVKKATKVFLRDVYDHTIQVIDTIETYRDIVSGMLDIYLSSISNKLNEIMKVLTIIATIFIPLTFITGLYGMNFKYMPELEWRWGYFGILSGMFIIGVAMFIYFKRKRWF